MSQQVRYSTLDLPTFMNSFTRSAIGFDTVFGKLLSQTTASAGNYPPHNIVKNSDTRYIIEVALAGFAEDEIDIYVEDNVLTVAGAITRDTPEYVYQGISNKAFTKVFNLADHVVVQEAKFNNGLLQIVVDIVVPDELKPRKISINSSVPKELK